jgi:Listeria/Bacterioides repeat
VAGIGDSEPTDWTQGTMADAISYANSLGGDTAYIQLLAGIDTSNYNGTWPLTFSSGKTTILDLNGQTIDRGLTAAASGGNVITVNGTLTLKDSSTTDVGHITGGYDSSSTKGSGGVLVDGSSSSFIMQGGNINGNTYTSESQGGGGVQVADAGSFVMNGGSIHDNKAQNMGGGVYVAGNSTFTMTGGSITGNTSKYGGVFVNQYFTVGGTAVIENNKTTADPSVDYNVMALSGKPMSVSSMEPLTSGAHIGVTAESSYPPTNGSPLNITGTNSADYSGYFVSDDSSYMIQNSADNVVQLAVPSPTIGTLAISGSFTAGHSLALSDLDGYTPNVKENNTTITAQGWQSCVGTGDSGDWTNWSEGELLLDTASTYKLRYYATYSGGTIYSNDVTLNVVGNTTTLALEASPESRQNVGNSVTLTATLTGFFESDDVNGQTITFKNDGTVLGTASLNADGVAVFTWTPESAGTAYNLTAAYAGSEYNTAAVSTPVGYTVDPNTVTFNSEDGSMVNPVTVSVSGAKVTKPDDPTKNGYTFAGWYTTKDLTTAWNFDSDTVTADTTLYAKWTVTHTVTFKDWDGSTLKTQFVNDGSAATAPANPSRSGYTFTGWDKAFSSVTGDLTVTAQYSYNGGYTGGGSTTPAKTDVTVPGSTTTAADGSSVSTATITPSQTDASTVNNAIVDIGNVTVTIPTAVANNALGNGTGLTLSQSAAPQATQAAAQDAAAKGNSTAVAVISIDLTRTTQTGTEAVHNLSGAVTVTITLTPEQIAAIKASGNPRIYYYDPTTGALTDMSATFDLSKGTATFTTTHFSDYVLATDSKTPPTVTGVSNNGIYNANKTITFDKGTATLDGTAFTSDSTVSAEGKHTLVVTDTAGNTATVVFTIDKTVPVVLGISNNGVYTTNKTITFNEGTAALDGTAFVSGTTVSKEGKHSLVVTDAAGNSTTVEFVLDKTAPVLSLKAGNKAVKNGGISSGAVTVRVSDLFSVTSTVTLNGKTIAWPKNGVFSKDGKYVVTVKDKNGLISKATFTVDRTAPKITAKRVKGSVTIAVTEANLLAETVTINGKKLAWPRGGKFTAKGKYAITVTDKAGHKTGFGFKI